MTHLLIDPFLLCVPTPLDNSSAEVFVSGLITWASCLQENDVLTHSMPQACMDEMVVQGLYPYEHSLKSVCQRLDAAIDETDIRTAVRYIINQSKSQHEVTKIVDVLTAAQIEPSIFAERIRQPDSFAKDLTCFAIAQNEQNTNFLFASNPEALGHGDLKITLNAEIVERTSGDITVDITLEESFPIHYDCRSVLRGVNCVDAWNKATKEHIIFSIEAKREQILAAGIPDGSANLNFCIGSKFIQSAHKWDFFSNEDRARNLIEECARVILAIAAAKPFRVSKDSGDQKIRNTDSALAFRVHVTGGKEGFRLMYWRLPDGTIEFANVGDKDELLIQ